MNGLGPLTQLNHARRARPAQDNAPWDELRAVFKITTSKSHEEFKKIVSDCTSWPSGWKLTIIVHSSPTRVTVGPKTFSVYFKVDHAPQHQAGAYVRATLSLLA